jgi:fatty-acyl-CoA synthase
MRAHCLQQLARFKVPERIVMVDAFPIVDSPNGPKVQRVCLREMAEAPLRAKMKSASDQTRKYS